MRCSLAEGRGGVNALTVPTSALLEAHAECAPVATAHEDRRRQILDQHEIAAAHVAAVGQQQEWARAGCDLLHRAIVEQAAVAAIGVVPEGILALRMAIVRIMRRQIAAFGPGDAGYDAWV